MRTLIKRIFKHWQPIGIATAIISVVISITMLVIDNLWVPTASPLYLQVLHVNKWFDDAIVIGLALAILGNYILVKRRLLHEKTN